MPVMRRCEKSGALIFDLTPDEQAVQDTKKELEALKEEMQEKIEELDKLIAKAKKEKQVKHKTTKKSSE